MTASTAVTCYMLQRKAFDSVLGPIQDVWRFEALRKVPILFSLNDSQLFSLAKCMTYHAIPAGQLVFCKGEPGKLHFCYRALNNLDYGPALDCPASGLSSILWPTCPF